MICPTCKTENYALAVRCLHCGSVLPPAGGGSGVDRQDPGAPAQGGDPPEPPSGGRAPSRAEDQKIGSAAPSAGSRAQNGPKVSTMSETPSDFIPEDDRTMDSHPLRGADSSPASAGTPPPSRTRPGGRLGQSGGLEPGMDFGP